MMLQKLVSLGFQRSITVDCGEITVGRRFRNCEWLIRNLILWYPDFRSIIHPFIAMKLRKSPQPVQQPKNCNCRKNWKLNALALAGNSMQSKSAVTNEVIIESYSCSTCIHPQGSLQKSLNILTTQEQTKRTI